MTLLVQPLPVGSQLLKRWQWREFNRETDVDFLWCE